MKKIKNNINAIIISIELLIATFLIGTPISDTQVYIVYILIGIHSTIYYIIQEKKKEKLNINIVDIFIALLTISTLIPLIFKTYVSLTEEVHLVIKAFVLCSIYFMAKIENEKKPKTKDIITNTVIISILILCIIGIDEINCNYLKNIKEFINYNYIQYDELRIQSLFAYPNAMAAVAGFGMLLCSGYIISCKKIKEKLIYVIATVIMGITLILTYSRLTYIIFGFFVILYMLILIKKYDLYKRITPKIMMGITFIFLILLAYIFVALNIESKLEIDDYYQKILYNASSNEEYNFEFYINAYSQTQDNFTIKIIEKNNLFDDIKTTTEQFSECEGKKEIKIITQQDTAVIYIEIESADGSTITINECILNNKKYILKYKFLPTKMIEKIQSINLKNKSAWERGVFIRDALKNIKNNWIFGYGGNAWQTLQYKTQEYNYYAKEVHCYPIQKFLEYGIIGFISCVGIEITILIMLYKECKNKTMNIQNISSKLAITFVFLHSLLDFDMSFFYIELIIFLIIATLERNNNINLKKYIQKILLVGIIINIISVYVISVEMSYKQNCKIFEKNTLNLDKINLYRNLIPYNSYVRIKKYNWIINDPDVSNLEKTVLIKQIIENEKYMNINLSLEYICSYLKLSRYTATSLDFAINYIVDTQQFSKFIPDLQIKRFNNMNEMLTRIREYKMENYEEILKQQLLKEIEEKQNDILDYKKARYEEKDVENYSKQLENIKNNI